MLYRPDLQNEFEHDKIGTENINLALSYLIYIEQGFAVATVLV